METAVSFLTIFISLIIHIKAVLTKSRSGWGWEQSLGLARLCRTWHSGSGSFLHPARVDKLSLQIQEKNERVLSLHFSSLSSLSPHSSPLAFFTASTE